MNILIKNSEVSLLLVLRQLLDQATIAKVETIKAMRERLSRKARDGK